MVAATVVLPMKLAESVFETGTVPSPEGTTALTVVPGATLGNVKFAPSAVMRHPVNVFAVFPVQVTVRILAPEVRVSTGALKKFGMPPAPMLILVEDGDENVPPLVVI
jgi:hypothetical protein